MSQRNQYPAVSSCWEEQLFLIWHFNVEYSIAALTLFSSTPEGCCQKRGLYDSEDGSFFKRGI